MSHNSLAYLLYVVLNDVKKEGRSILLSLELIKNPFDFQSNFPDQVKTFYLLLPDALSGADQIMSLVYIH